MSTTRTNLGVVFLITTALCLSFITWRVTGRNARLDLTQNSDYTLTEGAANLAAKLEEPVTFKLFYGETALDKLGINGTQFLDLYADYVRELAYAFERESGGKITVKEYDPQSFSDAEEEADDLGIRRQPVNMQNTEAFYFGMAAVTERGNRAVIEMFDVAKQQELEYRMAELLDKVTRRDKTRLGVLSSLEVVGEDLTPYMRQMMAMQGQQPNEGWAIAKDLRIKYDLVKVDPATGEIPSDLDYLLVVHPKDFSPQMNYALDQWVLRGGRAVVFVDPWAIVADPRPQDQPAYAGGEHNPASSLGPLMTSWGIRMAPETFAGDLELAQPLPTGSGGRVRFPGFIAMQDTDGELGLFNGDQVITKDLNSITMVAPGAIKAFGENTAYVTPLLQTTAKGNTWTASMSELSGFAGPDYLELAQKFTPGTEPVNLAVHIAGELATAFPDGAPKDPAAGDDGEVGPEPDATPTADHVAKSTSPANLIVVADVDMLFENVAVQDLSRMGIDARRPLNDNLAFLQNSLEFLAGSEDLISIRTRPPIRRPFAEVDRIEREAEAATQEKRAAIQEDIAEFRTKLTSLNSQVTDKNVGVLQNQVIDEQRKLEAEIRDKERELKQVQRDSLVELENLESNLRVGLIGILPGIVLLLGIAVAVLRSNTRRTFAKEAN